MVVLFFCFCQVVTVCDAGRVFCGVLFSPEPLCILSIPPSPPPSRFSLPPPLFLFLLPVSPALPPFFCLPCSLPPLFPPPSSSSSFKIYGWIGGGGVADVFTLWLGCAHIFPACPICVNFCLSSLLGYFCTYIESVFVLRLCYTRLLHGNILFCLFACFEVLFIYF